MYIFTVIVLRFAGKRRLAHLSPADLIIIIALGSAVGDVLIYPQSTTQLELAMLAVATIVILQVAMSKITEKSPIASYLIEGRRTILIKNGKAIVKNMDYEDVSWEDLYEMLAEKGVESPKQVKEAYLERSGELSVILSPIAPKYMARRLITRKKRVI